MTTEQRIPVVYDIPADRGKLSQVDVDSLRSANLHAVADIAQRYVNHYSRRKWWKLWLGR